MVVMQELRPELSDASKRLLQQRSEAYVRCVKAKLELAEAHSELVKQIVGDGVIDASIINVQYR